MKQLFFLFVLTSYFFLLDASSQESRTITLYSNRVIPEQFNLAFEAIAGQKFAGVVSSRNFYVPCMDETGALWDFAPGIFNQHRYVPLFCQTTPVLGSWVVRSADIPCYFVRSEVDTSRYFLCMIKDCLACPIMDEAGQSPILQLADDGKIVSFRIFDFAGTKDPLLQQAEAFAEVNATLKTRFAEQWASLHQGASRTIFAHENPWSLLVHGELSQMVDRLPLLMLSLVQKKIYASFLKNWHDQVYCKMPNVFRPRPLLLPEELADGYTPYTLEMVAPAIEPGPLYNCAAMFGAFLPVTPVMPLVPSCLPEQAAVQDDGAGVVESEPIQEKEQAETKPISKSAKRRAVRKRSSAKAQQQLKSLMQEQSQPSAAISESKGSELVEAHSPVAFEEDSVAVQERRIEQIVASINPDTLVFVGDRVIGFTQLQAVDVSASSLSKFELQQKKVQEHLAQAEKDLQERMVELKKKRLAQLIARNQARQQKLEDDILALRTAQKLHSEELAQWNEKIEQDEKIIARGGAEGKVLFEDCCKSLVKVIEQLVLESVTCGRVSWEYGKKGELAPGIHALAQKLRFFEKYQGIYQVDQMILDHSIFTTQSSDASLYRSCSFTNWCNAWFGEDKVASWVTENSVPSVSHVQKSMVQSSLVRKHRRKLLEFAQKNPKRVGSIHVNGESSVDILSSMDRARNISGSVGHKKDYTKTKLEALLSELVIALDCHVILFLHLMNDADLLSQVEEDIAFISQESSVCNVFKRIFRYEVIDRWSNDRPLTQNNLPMVFSFLMSDARMKCCMLSDSAQKSKYLRDDFFYQLLMDVVDRKYQDFSAERQMELISEACAAVYVMQKNKKTVPLKMIEEKMALYSQVCQSKNLPEFLLAMVLQQIS